MRALLKKLLAFAGTLLLVSFLAFLAFQVIPGDPTTKLLGTNATPEQVQALRESLGLDKPVLVRFWLWLTDFLHGDFGTSYSYKMPVAEMLADKLPATILLTVLSFALTAVAAIPLGIAAGSIKNRAADRLFLVLDQAVMAVPPFFLGILICFLLGLVLRLFVPGDFVRPQDDLAGSLHYLLFPALSLALPRIAMTAKMLRSSIRKEMGQYYVLTARSRGTKPAAVLLRHVLRNAMIPVVTFLAVSAAEIMTGTIIIEQVFTVPGIGRLLMASIGNRDFPVVQAIVVLLAAWIVAVNFLADIINEWMDPRVRLR